MKRNGIFEDILDDDHVNSTTSKRIKINLLDGFTEETTPLGLKLKKSPSLIDLIQREVFNKMNDKENTSTNNVDDDIKEQEKMKASNFPACLLKIGSWEKISINEGHIVTKFYFAKHKIVWEILECKMKRKIEIQWSEVSAIQATFHEEQSSVLEVEVKKPPLFFEERNPQPKKHTIWNPTADFTGGQASNYRIHRLEFTGVLKKHYDKLMAYDKRLKNMSQRPFPSSNSPLFPLPKSSINNFNLHGQDLLTEPIFPYNRINAISLHNSNSHAFQPNSMFANVGTPSNNLPSIHTYIINSIHDFNGSNLEMDNHVTSSNNFWWNNKSSGGIYDILLQELNKDHGESNSGSNNSNDSSNPSNFWELEDIVDHLFDDSPSPIDSNDESLMRKIRSINAHLDKLPMENCLFED